MNYPIKHSTASRRSNPRGMAVLVSTLLASAAMALATTLPAAALSEIQQDATTPPAADDTIESQPLPPVGTVPLPDESQPATPGVEAPEEEGPTPEDQADPAEPEGEVVGRPEVDSDAPLPEVRYNLDALPEQARRMHDLIVEATRTGDIEKLRPLIGTGNDATQLSLGGVDSDPIDFLKELSGDAEGQEILAILQEVLTAGYVHLDPGTPQELYVWPYFFAVPLERLTPPQRVELFKIVTAGDYEDMKSYGAYIFYRVGITPAGEWQFFVAGD